MTGLVEDIQQVLVRVEPRADFRECLRERLSSMVLQTPPREIARPREVRRWALVLLATLGSLVPVLGVISYLLRLWVTGKEQHAASR